MLGVEASPGVPGPAQSSAHLGATPDPRRPVARCRPVDLSCSDVEALLENVGLGRFKSELFGLDGAELGKASVEDIADLGVPRLIASKIRAELAKLEAEASLTAGELLAKDIQRCHRQGYEHSRGLRLEVVRSSDPDSLPLGTTFDVDTHVVTVCRAEPGAVSAVVEVGSTDTNLTHSELRLADKTVSRKHATLTRFKKAAIEGYSVRDDGSKQGSAVLALRHNSPLECEWLGGKCCPATPFDGSLKSGESGETASALPTGT